MNEIERMILTNQRHIVSVLKILVCHTLQIPDDDYTVNGLTTVYDRISSALKKGCADDGD